MGGDPTSREKVRLLRIIDSIPAPLQLHYPDEVQHD